jgi:hypothetical protein
VSVGIDRTTPTIRHEFTPGSNANGWFSADVSVHFICNDSHSGILSCGPDRVVATEGRDKDAGGTAVDRAGNSVHDPATVSLERTPPSIKASVDREPNANGWYGNDVTVSFACADALSGVDVCTSAQVLGKGEDQSARGTVHDAAGNTATVSGSYRVIYRFDGFLQPINDPAHQVGAGESVFKGGSTVPVKFQLKWGAVPWCRPTPRRSGWCPPRAAPRRRRPARRSTPSLPTALAATGGKGPNTSSAGRRRAPRAGTTTGSASGSTTVRRTP